MNSRESNLFIYLTLVLAGSGLRASLAIADSYPWADPSKYQDCGQSCLYAKGNENISLEAAYAIEKIELLEKARGDQDFGDKVRDSLGLFCDFSVEDEDGCFNRYVKIQSLSLHKMRVAIAKNKHSISELESNVPRAATPIRPGRKPQTTYVPTLADLEKTPARMTQAEYRAAIESFKKSPSKDDYYKIVEIDRVPGNATGGKLQTVKFDHAAYQKALKEYDDYLAQNPQIANNPNNHLQQMASRSLSQADLNSMRIRDRKDKTTKDVSLDAFGNARSLMVDTANGAMKKLGYSVKTIKPTPARTTASQNSINYKNRDAAIQQKNFDHKLDDQVIDPDPSDGTRDESVSISWDVDDLGKVIQNIP